ncbi:MAG TPA: DUF3617 domain-containing protein [Thermoanaerobaculia bacterium]|nr:DUF3617 domain-containing protein [Thermoanaerobaculia bacterium]
MRKVVLSAVALLALALPVLAQSPQKPGQWQVKMEMEMPGMPFKMPPVNFEICLTEEDLKDPQKSVPNDPKSKCTVSDYKVDGNTVTWTVDCPKQGTKGNGEITFTEDSYNGWMKMQVGEQEMKTKYTGKWKGECAKKK